MVIPPDGLAWGPWQTDPSADPGNPATFATPYGHWYETVECLTAPLSGGFSTGPQGAAGAIFPGIPLPRLTLPIRALPPGGAINPPGPRPDPSPKIGRDLQSDSVIVGVIDSGVALAHERFRRPDGGTRILNAWQQGGAWGGQMHLPFGSELMQADIDAAMAASPTPHGVDEAAFNRRAGLVDYADAASERWIETAAPHGTHVADLAAGFDPAAKGSERDRLPMIVVNLAPRAAIGPSGSFLEFYVIWAIRHIVTTADAIWQSRFASADKVGQKGFPVVINLSYGLLAGPRDGTMAVQKYVAALNAGRAGRPPVVLMLPAGNDNLEAGAATLAFAPASPDPSLGWRLTPEDRTSSYAEVWSEPVPGPAFPGAPHPLAITVATPDGIAGPGLAGAAGQYCTLTWIAGGVPEVVGRIYCRAADDGTAAAPATRHRLVYVICVAPTWRMPQRAAPAGLWTITLSSGGVAATARLHVQSDQDLTPGSGTAYMSHFDDPAYAPYDAVGRVLDSYLWDRATNAVTATFGSGPVQRKNTLNAIAGGAGTLTIGGYRATDGLPADYSSADDDPASAPWLNYACVSDDGVWRIGRLAAGSRSGSAVVMQGTSFATGEATRIVAHDLLRQLPGPVVVAGPGFLPNVPGALPAYPVAPSDMPLKLGTARLPSQDHGRVGR
jgi:hypothetical protein